MDDQENRRLLWPGHQGGPNAAKEGPVLVVPPQGTREELSTLPSVVEDVGKRTNGTTLRPRINPPQRSSLQLTPTSPPSAPNFLAREAQGRSSDFGLSAQRAQPLLCGQVVVTCPFHATLPAKMYSSSWTSD